MQMVESMMFEPGTINKGDYPLLLETMKQDGLFYTHSMSGIEWHQHSASGKAYKLQKSILRKEWGICQSTWRKFTDWIIEVN